MECRKSVRDLTDTEKGAYVDAVLALKSTAPSLIPAAQTAVTAGGGTPNRYDDYVWMHNTLGLGGHRGSAFGPWHREFLRQFELDLRQVSGNPDISIPYWDWTTERTPASPGWPFTDDFMGGFGGPDFQISTGPFSNPATWRMNIRADALLTLKRNNVGVPAPGPLPTRNTVRPSLSGGAGGLDIGVYDAAPFNEDPNVPPPQSQVNASWRKYLERRLHDGVHVWIGGANANFTNGGHMTFPALAVNDPIFFLHHCNVDRLWTIWQQLHPGLGYVPASGANPGHNATDVMSRFATQAHFNFPLANRPIDQDDYHARGVWFRSDLPVVAPPAGSLGFGNVPAELTTFRPVRFEVRTCQRARFRISAIGGANFSIPPNQNDVVVDHSATTDPVVANVYVAYTAPATPASPPAPQVGTVTIEAYIDDADGYFEPNVNDEHLVGSWNVNLLATPVPRPRSAVVMALDRSGSMAESAGPAGTKADLLKSSLAAVAHIMRDDDAIGLVSYDHAFTTLAPVTEMGPESPPGPGRAAVDAAIGGTDLNPRGATGIGGGMIQAAGVLDAERLNASTPYTRFAMVVMTDGNQNVHPYVTEPPVTNAIAGFSDSVYAIGLGRETGVSAPTLGSIARYMLITGDITTAEQTFRLTKYFIQILASVSRLAIVTDPSGELLLGAEHRVPFTLTEADVGADVVVLSPAAPLIEMRLESPDGTVIDSSGGSPNVAFHQGQKDGYFRLGLPAIPGTTGTHEGDWTAVLTLSRKATGRALIRKALAQAVAPTRSVPYSFFVQSYSNLVLHAEAHPATAAPGDSIRLAALLTEYDVPVERRAHVMVEVSRPGGELDRLELSETAPGTFEGEYRAPFRGVYTLRFRAVGTTLGGRRFEREETRTTAVFPPGAGGDPADGGRETGTAGGSDREGLCRLIECLLANAGLDRLLARNDIDPDVFAKCLEEYCRGARDERRDDEEKR